MTRDYTLNNKYPLTDEQNEGVEFLLNNPNSILGFKTGLGKTLCALTTANIITDKYNDIDIVIVCPKSATSSFKKELETKLNTKYSIFTTDEVNKDIDARINIFNYSNLTYLIEFINTTNRRLVVFLDEVHLLSNRKSNQNRILISLRRQFLAVYGITATVLLNNPKGLYNIINYIRPNYLGSFNYFKSKYCKTKNITIRRNGKLLKIEDIVGLKNTEELSDILSKIIIVRKKDYNIDFKYYKTKMTNEEYLKYKEASEGLLTEDLSIKLFSSRLHDLQRVVDGSLFESSTLSSKEKLLLKTIIEIFNRNESVLIYTEYESTYKRLGNIIRYFKSMLGYSNLFYITGKVKYEDRVKVETSIIDKSIVIITKAGSQSINLQSANNLIIYNIPFSMGVYIQLLGRISRLDTKYDIQHVYHIEMEDTIDTYKRLLVQSHLKDIENLFGDDSNLPESKSINNIKKLRDMLLWKKYI